MEINCIPIEEKFFHGRNIIASIFGHPNPSHIISNQNPFDNELVFVLITFGAGAKNRHPTIRSDFGHAKIAFSKNSHEETRIR